jgi:Colicin V production protein
MIIDIFVALIVLGAAFVGFQRGFIQPLLAEILFVGSLLVLLNNRDAYLAFMNGVFHANAFVAVLAALIIATVFSYAGIRVGGIIHRMPSVRGWDGFLGVFVQALVAIVFAYGLISAMVVVNKAVAPAVNNAALTVAQVRNLQKQLESNTLTAPLGDSQDFRTLLSRASKPGGGHLTDATQLDQVQTLYQDLFQPQLRTSRLAPWVMRIGQHVPGVGRFGPSDLPRR